MLKSRTTVRSYDSPRRPEIGVRHFGGRNYANTEVEEVPLATANANLQPPPQDVLSAVSLLRQSTSWPHGRYWRSAQIVPSALDTAAGVSPALRVISLPGIALAVSVIKDLMENANNSGPYRRPSSRRVSLTPTIASVLDVAYARDNADRKLRSRMARKLATSQPRTPGSPGLAR
jgi:hypothetical protein